MMRRAKMFCWDRRGEKSENLPLRWREREERDSFAGDADVVKTRDGDPLKLT
jgi:hypothetical protein